MGETPKKQRQPQQETAKLKQQTIVVEENFRPQFYVILSAKMFIPLLTYSPLQSADRTHPHLKVPKN